MTESDYTLLKVTMVELDKISTSGVILVHIPCIFLHSERIWRDTLSASSLNVEKCRNNADQNDSRYGHFYAV